MRPPKTDCIFEISIKKCDNKGKKIDKRNYRTKSLYFNGFYTSIYKHTKRIVKGYV